MAAEAVVGWGLLHTTLLSLCICLPGCVPLALGAGFLFFLSYLHFLVGSVSLPVSQVIGLLKTTLKAVVYLLLDFSH